MTRVAERPVQAAPAADVSAARRRLALRVAASATILAVLVAFLPRQELVAALGRLPAVAWPVAVAAYLLMHGIGVAKWRLLVNAVGAGLAARPATQAYYWGLFGNLFLPSLVGGDVVRATVAFGHARSRSALLLGSVIDRVQDVLALGVLAGIGALLSPQALDDRSRGVFVAFLALVGGSAVVMLAAALLFRARMLSFGMRRKLRLVPLRRALRAAAHHPGHLLLAFTAGLALQTLLILLNWRLGALIGLEAPLFVWLFVWPLAKIAGLLPVTQGGIGVREAALVALFAPFNVSAALAVATGLVFEGVIITGGLLGGGIATLLRWSHGFWRHEPSSPSAS